MTVWLCYSINMSYKFNKNQKLLIQLINGDVIEGQFVSSTSSRLDVRNCLTPHTQTKDPSTQHFYESEIVNVKAFELEDVQSDTSEEQLKVEVEANKIIKIPQNKYNALKALNKSYVYMATMDARYYTAVDDLVNCETIACTILSTDFGRAAPIELLVLATWEQVYIFDISLYNCKQFPDALKYILECEDIVKVVHDSRGLVDCMHHQYHIKVMNIFDTYVATQMVSDEKLTLPECLLYYFNFPLTLIKEAMDLKQMSEWGRRPLSDEMKQYAAMNVQYLITLKNYLQKQLLKEFHERVLKHSQSTIEQSYLNAQMSLGCLNINKE